MLPLQDENCARNDRFMLLLPGHNYARRNLFHVAIITALGLAVLSRLFKSGGEGVSFYNNTLEGG